MTVENDHKAATWGQFVARLLDTTYREAKKGRWGMDNLSTHRISNFYAHFPPEVARADVQRMEISSPPVHGSWLKMAEMDFSVLTRQGLDRSVSSKEAVQAVVERWKNKQKANLKPRNWQFKTADARIKLNRLYPTI